MLIVAWPWSYCSQSLLALVVEHRAEADDRRGRARDVRGAAPDLRELRQLRAIGHEHEVPRLPVARRRSAPAGLEDPVEIGVRDRALGEHADVAPRPDRIPGLHPRDDSASLRADRGAHTG